MSEPTSRGGFFAMRDGLYVPSAAQNSPWTAGYQNGMGIGGLLMHLTHHVETPAPMTPVRMNIEILGQLAHKPFEGRAEVVRPGRRMQIVEASLISDGQVAARGRLLRIRKTETPVLDGDPHSFTGPEGLGMRPPNARIPAMADAIEMRLDPTAPRDRGHGRIWTRMKWDLIEGVETAPIVHAAMLADSGSGASNPGDRTKWISPNLDISLHFSREPVGDWLVLDARTVLNGQGSGLVNMVLGDRDGAFARAHQSLFIGPRGEG